MPDGWRAIEAVRIGDFVLSRDEFDPAAPAEYKVVEAVFRRTAAVWHLTAAGRLIRTTGEHPFFEQVKGWVPARELAVGDRLVCEDGSTVAVEEVLDTGEWEVVYNLRVADHHTYFVGQDEWGFAVWAHNTYFRIVNPHAGHSYPDGVETPAAKKKYRTSVFRAELESLRLSSRYHIKHFRAIGSSEDTAREISLRGDAQYMPFISREHAGELERITLEKGFLVNHGGTILAFALFDHDVGYNGGEPTAWIRAELTNGGTNIHGHPFDPDYLPDGAVEHFEGH